MGKKIVIDVQETAAVIARLLARCPEKHKAKLKMLQLIKVNKIYPKRNLAQELHVSSTCIQKWLKKYKDGGRDKLLNKKKKKETIINGNINLSLQGLLKRNNKSYAEILRQLNIRFRKEIKYSTFIKHCKRKFPSKCAEFDIRIEKMRLIHLKSRL